ncbi:hypothetical protein [Agreia pratensis]|uniref:DUF4190 domain-containing protein n=1 Tax=Agreia pratensis TaxID=150121 RepID=A0A1X7IR44_9MICO|nr:hypothetical protein [Agreia pratensis]SMG17591.1 hypothetical protein SAMN06296010_0793 [Agreia pratensis]
MTQADGSLPADGAAPTGAGGRVSGRTPLVALWLAIAAVIAPVFYYEFFPLVGLGAVAAVVALVLMFRARSRGQRGAILRWTAVLAVIGLVVDLVVVVIMVVLLTARPVDVEVRATGGPTFTVTYADDFQTYTEEWQKDGVKWWNTTKKTVEITVTPSPGGEGYLHSCQIRYGGAVVDQESSDTGPVTCHYDAPWPLK